MNGQVGGRHGYWFPLVLLGFGLLGLLAWHGLRAGQDYGWFAYTPPPPDTEEHTLIVVTYSTWPQAGLGRYPLRDWPWAVLVTATLVATVAWYGWRARRAGGSVRTHVILAVGGGIAVLFCYAITGMAGSFTDPAGLVTSVGLPLLGLGAMAGAWAYVQRRRVAAVVSIACLVAGVGIVLGAWAPGLLDPLVIAGGLLALARYERSRVLAVVAGVVLVVMVVFPDGAPSMLFPAVVTLATGVVVLARQHRQTGLSGQ